MRGTQHLSATRGHVHVVPVGASARHAGDLCSDVAHLSSSKFAYSWSFGDLGASVQADPTHTFTATGTRAVTLLVTDS